MKAFVAVIKPVLVKALNSCAVKKLVCDLIDKYVSTTDNNIDNHIAKMVRDALLKEC
jgi:hypothetical protein